MVVRDVLHYVPQCMLDESRDFLYRRGLEGCEGTALWIGRPVGGEVLLTRLFVPEQVCIKTAYGIGVDLTERAHYTLTDTLEPGERFYARIHSHPREAFHSKRDDANAVITHQGALSIVVPNFAIDPIDLTQCAIYRLEHGRGWLRLSVEDIAKIFEVVL